MTRRNNAQDLLRFQASGSELMCPSLNLWLMQLPIWRWFARAAGRVIGEDTERYREAKARADYGVFGNFRPSNERNTGDTKREQ